MRSPDPDRYRFADTALAAHYCDLFVAHVRSSAGSEHQKRIEQQLSQTFSIFLVDAGLPPDFGVRRRERRGGLVPPPRRAFRRYSRRWTKRPL